MTGEPAHLRRGRERYQGSPEARRRREAAKALRRREAIKRVTAFKRWCAKGSPMGKGQVPAIPSNADFKLARGERG